MARGKRPMRHRAALPGAVVLLLVLSFATLWPTIVQAASAGQQATPAPAANPSQGPTGSIDAQAGALNGQVALGRGSASLNASVTETGPQGQVNLSAPGLFAASVSVGDNAVDTTATLCFGERQITVSAARGGGLHLQLQPSSDNANGCTLPSSARTALTMGPMLALAQAAPDSSPGFTDRLLEALRRFVVLAVIAGLLWLLVPAIPGSVVAAARTAPWSRLGVGLCLAITIPIVGIAIFVVGLPLGLWWMGLLVLAFYACLLAISFALTGLVVGAWLGERIPGRQIPPAAVFAVGLFLLSVLGLLPGVGALVNLVAVVYGVGALVAAPRARVAQTAVAAPAAAAVVPVAEAPTAAPIEAPVETAPTAAPTVETQPPLASVSVDHPPLAESTSSGDPVPS